MKAIIAPALAALVSAHALHSRDFQPVALNLQAGPISYDLNFVADGQEHFTNNDLNVNLITAPDFDAYHLCTFKTASDEVTFAPSLTQRPVDFWPVNQIAVGPPQKIISVTCSGTCVTVYGEYFSNHSVAVSLGGSSLTEAHFKGECYNSTTGQYVGSCCNGFCAANRCRPWSTGSG